MRHAATLASLLLLLALQPTPGVARTQNAEWRRRNEKPNRFEGVITKQVGNQALEVLALTGFFEPFSGNVNLKVRFFYPQGKNLSLTAQELLDLRQYWMEAKPHRWKAGAWNEFAPWPTGDVLLREDIAPDNIGVLIKLDGDNLLLPAFTFHSRVPERATRYSLYLRSNKNLKGVTFTLSEAGPKPKSPPKSFTLGPQSAEVSFRADLDVQGFADGPIRVAVELRPRDGAPKTDEFRFYHRQTVR